MKNFKGNIQPKEVSVVNTDLSLKVRRLMLICIHQFGWLSERGMGRVTF